MAKGRVTGPPPPQAPRMTPEEGIKYLREQVTRAGALLTNYSASADELDNWMRTTNQLLSDALGDGHYLMSSAVAAGAQRKIYAGNEDRLHQKRQQVERQMKALTPCIEQLEREIEMHAKTSPRLGDGERSHDDALVCHRGHLITDTVHRQPAYNAKFCAKCGAGAVTKCSKCGQPIQGARVSESSIVHIPGPPAYCLSCGEPFPWTEAARKALSELLAMTDASEGDQAALRDSLPALAAESPETPVAIAKWRKFLMGAGKQMASGFKDLVVEIAAEAVKRKMFPDGS